MVLSMEITIGHGAGGELMNQLLAQAVLKNISRKGAGEVGLDDLDDGGSVSVGDVEVVVSTDSYTVKPIFFPGGDIGRLAMCGTINDVSVMGAKPLAVASALVIEEGFRTEDLERITKSMDEVSREAGVSIITGDTKVMEKNALDGIIITTTGIGIAPKGKVIKDSNIRPGDKIILTGSLGDHGISLMSYREGFGFETSLKSDVAPLWGLIGRVLPLGGVRAMRDPTRGGLSATLNDWARKAGVGIVVREEKVPLKDGVKAASEMLGIDPFMVANEGKAVIGVEARKALGVLQAIKSTKLGRDAQIIGEVVDKYRGKVVLETVVGGRRIMEPPLGDPVPRVC
jgi:hydrogenase expression/formation protein HypE